MFAYGNSLFGKVNFALESKKSKNQIFVPTYPKPYNDQQTALFELARNVDMLSRNIP